MDAILRIILITALSGVVGTGLGGAVGAVFRQNSTRIVSLLLSFAGGVMLSIVCFDLLSEAISPPNAAGNTSIFIVIAGTMLGYVLIYLLNDLIDHATNHEVQHIDEDHPQTADDLDELIHSDHYETHKKGDNRFAALFLAGLVMACAIALHNFPEGMVIGASYAIGSVSELGSVSSALVLAVVIGLHNIPEGMAVSVPLIAGGMGRVRAVLLTALSGVPTILGALLGYSLGLVGPLLLSISLSFASGAMLYVVLGELLPESILMWRSKAPAFAALIGIVLGMVIIFA